MAHKNTSIHEEVQARYGGIAARTGSCCGGNATGAAVSQAVGYSEEDLAAAPTEANLGLGCGNPVALSNLKAGETVLDLGSGAGFDCFLAVRQVGESGAVIGVDMTPAMLERARKNADAGGFKNVEFREGPIEALPVEDAQVDVVLSNCVINLSPDKPQVFREAYRVLRPGGRLHVSDLVLLRPLPWFLRRSMALYTACVAGALQRDDYIAAIRDGGFIEITVEGETNYPVEALEADPTLRPWVRIGKRIPPIRRVAESVVSLKVSARKPGTSAA